MKKLCLTLLLLALAVTSQAQPIIPSTAFTRDTLRSTNAAQFRDKLGFTNTSTVLVVVTNIVTNNVLTTNIYLTTNYSTLTNYFNTTNLTTNYFVATNLPANLDTNVFATTNETSALSNYFYTTDSFTRGMVGLGDFNNRTLMTNQIRDISERVGVKTFGAVGDGKLVTNCVMETGSSTLTAAGADFKITDIGKVFSLYLGQFTNLTASSNFTTTIASVNNSTSIVLALSNPIGVTNRSAVYGTDDTAAIQAGLNFISTNGGGTLFFPAGIYVVNGPIQDPATEVDLPCYNGATRTDLHKNAQLVLPDIPPTGYSVPTVRLEGAFAPSTAWTLESIVKPGGQGSILWSTLPDLGGGSVFACENFTCPANNGGGADHQRYINAVRVEIANLTVRVAENPNGNGIDLRGASTVRVHDILIDSGHSVYLVPEPQRRNSFGIWFPPAFTNGEHQGDHITVVGFENAFGMGEHITLGQITAYSCRVAMNFTNAFGHLTTLSRGDFESCKTYILCGNYYFSLAATLTTENNFCTNVIIFGQNVPAWDYPDINTKPVLVSGGGSMSGHIVYRHSEVGDATETVPMRCTPADPPVLIERITTVGRKPKFESLLSATNISASAMWVTNGVNGSYQLKVGGVANTAEGRILLGSAINDPLATSLIIRNFQDWTDFMTWNAALGAFVYNLHLDGTKGYAGFAGPVITNGNVCWYVTNNTPTMPLPDGSICTAGNGKFFVRKNSAWVDLTASSNPVTPPIGSVMPWLGSMTGTPALPDGWARCDGQVLDDFDSPYDQTTLPDLNGAVDGIPKFLMGGATSGTASGSATHDHTYTNLVQAASSEAQAAGAATGIYGLKSDTPNIDGASSLPPYFTVVWIMRIK